jgi:hypothetical protein
VWATLSRQCAGATTKPELDKASSKDGCHDDLGSVDEQIEPTDGQLPADPACHRTDSHAQYPDHDSSEPQRPYREACKPERDAAENGEDLVHRDLLGYATFDRTEWREHN